MRAGARCENCNEVSTSFAEYDAKFFRCNRAGREEGSLTVCNRCMDCYEARRKATNDILSSEAPKKLIVAGPGTGKSFTFRLLLEGVSKEKPSLVFTLINNLVDDLERDLAELGNEQIKVNTLHGYCKESLHRNVCLDDINTGFEYLPPLPDLIEANAAFLGLGFSENDFHSDFVNLKNDSEALAFYLRQSAYYNAVSYNDSVYRVFGFYRANPQSVPRYEIIIVDEYQDFNLLEASFIQCLAAENNIVIVGDDDQSLYAFRHASNKYIRELWKLDDFAKFPLPYCSRCTPVLVEAANAFIRNAQESGLLEGRIDRAFQCYWPEKHAEHKAYPRILVADCSKLNTVCEFVKQRVLSITKQEGLNGTEHDIQFLVIGPESGYHTKKLQDALSEELDSAVFDIECPQKKESLVIEQGYSLILDKRNLNLGWRIVLQCEPLETAKDIIKTAYQEGTAMEELLPRDYLDKHRKILAEQPQAEVVEEKQEPPKRIRIKLTNFYGSKGLTALHTIVIGLNDHVFPKDPGHLNDDEACKFIVALTRAKRSCCLVTNGEFSKERKITVKSPSRYIQLLHARVKQEKRYKIIDGCLVEY